MVAETQSTTATPPIGVLTALRRHWIVASVPVILLVGAALMLGLQRAPRYTATANLSVGRIYVDNPAGVSGVIEATRSLASVYSRAINASEVREDTARRLGDDSLRGSERLSATQLPDSPLIKISAEAPSAGRAVALTRAASAALAEYVKRHERTADDLDILSRYRRAARRYRDQTQVNRRLAARYERDPTSENKAAVDRAAIITSTDLLRRNALRTSYLAAVQGRTSPPSIEVFTRATSARSDRTETLQIMLLVGLIAGLAAGTALALLRAYRKNRRRSGA